MESLHLTGPLFYLTIAWGVVTTVFIGLLIWRSLLASHEDDQIFLDAAEAHMAREQQELIAKIRSLSRPLAGWPDILRRRWVIWPSAPASATASFGVGSRRRSLRSSPSPTSVSA